MRVIAIEDLENLERVASQTVGFHLGDVLGVYCLSQQLPSNKIEQWVQSNASQDNQYRADKGLVSYQLKGTYGDLELSKREAQCLYYALRGKVNREIAKILKLSPHTIEDYFYNIKDKMRCSTKSQVIEKSVALGFTQIIPEGLKHFI